MSPFRGAFTKVRAWMKARASSRVWAVRMV